MPSPFVSADFDNGVSPEVEHAGEPSVSDAFFFVEVSDALYGFFRDRGIVMSGSDAEPVLVDRNEGHLRFDFFARAGRDFMLLVFLAHRFAIFGCFANMKPCCALDLNGISIPS